jgi:hypothetical protein
VDATLDRLGDPTSCTMEIITPLPASLRYQIISDLPVLSERHFALDVLKCLDKE